MNRVLVVLALSVFAGRAPAAPPNVVVILTDDQGYGDLSLHGNPHVKTPVIDRFAKDGIQFDRFFVSPVCSPTRASLLTGRYSLRTGVWGVTHGKEVMRLSEVTLADFLRQAGYRTACIGKWHNGEQYPYTPTGRGFDEFFGFHNGHWNNYFDADLLRGPSFVKTKGYIADVLTDSAIKFVEDNRARPFLCYLAYNTPHSPFQVPDQYFNRFKQLSPELASIYGMVENLDLNIGRLLAKLEELGLRENTIVIFMTDNGPSSDRFNALMRGRKGSVHEGGIRVPFFVQWPARYKRPMTVPQIAAHIDVLPTLLELCGAPAPKNLDGKSLVPLMEDKAQSWPERTLFAHQFKAGEVTMFPGSARTQKHRAVNDGKGWQLFDMASDPNQKSDIAKSAPDVLKSMQTAYEAWFKDVTRAGFVRFPVPIGHEQENPVTLHAPQAQFEGGVRFFAGPGFANDWLTGWTKSGKVWWDIDVARPAKYQVSLSYTCPMENAGAAIRLSVVGQHLEAKVPGAPPKEIPLPHRAGNEKRTYTNRAWATLDLGTITLPSGQTRATLEATSLAGSEVMDLKDLRFKRIEN